MVGLKHAGVSFSRSLKAFMFPLRDLPAAGDSLVTSGDSDWWGYLFAAYNRLVLSSVCPWKHFADKSV